MIPDKDTVADGFGTGVIGASGRGNGVEGISDSATGVVGKSKSGTGAVFSSENRAQINLVPKLNNLPVEGQVGDLLFIASYEPTAGTGLPPALWLCVKARDPNDPAKWREVRLGDEEVSGKL